MKDLQKDRLLELLADQAVFGLSAEEMTEFGQLKKQFPDWEKDFSLELTAAAIGLSDLDVTDDLPANLRERVFTDADEFFKQKEESPRAVNFASEAQTTVGALNTERVRKIVETEPQRPFWQWLGWAFAAVACVALAINLWQTRARTQPEVVKNPETIQTPTPELSAAQKRAQLLASAKDIVQVPLANPKDEKEVIGDVVWSNSMQSGYVRLRGLPVNDISKESYQLWIVDETQNPKTPISGGVFDVSATGEIVVPINAELAVKKPKAVAISKEKTGGVVVSQPDRVVAIAKI